MQMSEFEKRSIVEAQLTEGFRNPDAEIAENELHAILTKKNQGRPFNPDLFEQLLEQLRKSGQPLTVRNFTDIWLQAESRLQSSVSQMDAELQSSVRERDELVEQKKRYANEQLNAYGIMSGSQLVVVVRSIEHITKADGTRTNANFVLSCEGQSAETGNSVDPDFFNVNKTFKFNIQTGNDPLLINLLPTASNDPKDGGYIQVPLSSLNSQEVQNQTYTFSTEFNQLMQTNADLQLQWVYSNVKLLNRGVQEMNENIANKKRNKESAESYIEDLYGPFPAFKKTLRPKERTVAAGVFNPSTVVVNEKQFSKMPESAHSIFSKLLLYAIYVYLFVAFLLCFHRSIFLDLLVALLLFSAVLLNNPKLIRSFINKVIGGVVLALLIDVVWLVLYTRQWWTTTYQDSSSLLYTRRAMVVFSYVIMLVRLFVLVIIGVSYNDFGSGEDEFEAEADHASAAHPAFQY